MARAAIFEKITKRFASASLKESHNTSFDNIEHNASIYESRRGITSLKSKDFSVSSFEDVSVTTQVDSVLPFRVRFMNIGIESYGPNNPAPIGIAIIGFNNYIL
jgi:hypothetical protein